MVVAQMVERSLPIPEVRGSNPVIDKKLYRTLTVNCIKNNTIFKTNQCEKCHYHPVYGAGIRSHNLLHMNRLP